MNIKQIVTHNNDFLLLSLLSVSISLSLSLSNNFFCYSVHPL